MAKTNPLILIVDDELHMSNVLRRLLEKEGYRVLTSSDGKTALQVTREKSPDLILLDLMMPGMDGREVCRRVRQLSTKTRVIYFTAKAEPDPSNSKELRSEADAFIPKPATSKKILSTVNKVLKSI